MESLDSAKPIEAVKASMRCALPSGVHTACGHRDSTERAAFAWRVKVIMMNPDRHAPATDLPPHTADPEQPAGDAESLMKEGTLGHTLAEALDTFILDRFSTTLEDQHGGRKITRCDS